MTADPPPVPKTIIGSGIMQFLVGAVALNAGSISLVLDCYLGYIGAGIWVGAFVIMTAGVGLLTSFFRQQAWVISYLALSAFCFLLAIVLASIEMVAWYEENNNCEGQPIACDYKCIRLHEVNIAAGAAEIVASLVSVALCIQALLGYIATPYKKMVQQNSNI